MTLPTTTRKTISRIAGFAFLFYIAAGIMSLVLSNQAIGAGDIATKLASIAQHQTILGVIVLISLLTSLSAITLGITLYALTREQNDVVAIGGMICRAIEGIFGLFLIPRMLGLLWLAKSASTIPPDAGTAKVLAAFLLQVSWSPSAFFFAIGSLLFSLLLLRGRLIPAPLAWLGVASSVLLVLILPLQLAGLFPAPLSWTGIITWLTFLPMAVFEIVFALWLLFKGISGPATVPSDH